MKRSPSLVDDCTIQSARSANSTIAHTRDDSGQRSIYTETTDIDGDSVNTFLSDIKPRNFAYSRIHSLYQSQNVFFQ